MGSTLIGDSKLNFFPTSIKEIYRILGVVGRVSLSVQSKELLKKKLGKHNYNSILIQAMDDGSYNTDYYFYEHFLNTGEYDSINKYFEIAYGFSNKQIYTIADLFAGEGKWLESFKSFIPNENTGSAKLHLIANELEMNRFNKIKNNNLIDEAYNQAFENFNDIPRNSISLMLYNPPYGDTNGVRNVKHYLQMIIDRQLIHNSKGTQSYKNGAIVMVIRKDDLLDSLPLIVKHFDVYKDHIYKTHKEEYKKFKQYVIYATLKRDLLNDKNSNDALKMQSEVKEIAKIVNSEPEFNIGMYKLLHYDLPDIPYEEMKENYTIVKEEKYYTSDLNNSNWQWIREVTEIKDVNHEKIVKPTPLKSGELANLIASGMINGELSMKNGKGKHIVAGGTRNKERVETYQEEDRNGKLQSMTRTTRYSEPYLNILISENGKVKIKELSGESELL